MSDTRMLQIVSECAYVTTDAPTGRTRVLLMKGAIFPGDAPEAGHLLSSGMAVVVGGDVAGGVDADGNPDAVVVARTPKATPSKKAEQPPSTDADVAALRERAVKAGLDPAEVAKASPEDLRATLKE